VLGERHDAIAARFVTHEGLPERYVLVEPRGQRLAKRDAADRAMLFHGIAAVLGEGADRDQRLHALTTDGWRRVAD
jgi:hypothetical protein